MTGNLFHPDLAVIVLAAGVGKRFRSQIPKVLHRLNGLPLIHYAIGAVNGLAPSRLVIVTGPAPATIPEALGEAGAAAEYIAQPEPLGTGDAVRRCREALEGFAGPLLVVNGDCPLLRTESLARLVAEHRRAEADASLLTALLPDPAGYGRIVRGAAGEFLRIVEEADASETERAIVEVSSGIWCFEPAPLFGALEQVTPHNLQGEYYLGDAAFIITSKGGMMYTVTIENPGEVVGVNDRGQLAEAARELRVRLIEKLAAAGVTFEDPEATYIEEGVEIGPDTLIRPNTYLRGATRIGSGCTIGPLADISDSTVGDETQILFAVIREASVGRGCSVGPFVYLRPGTRLEQGAKAGSFVEITRSVIGEGSKVPHLSYVGDTEMGRDVNLGAGTITGNYDGETETKSKTIIEDGVDTGSGTTIVAPARLGEQAVTGAGSVVTKDVEPGDVVVGVPARPMRKRRDSSQRDH